MAGWEPKVVRRMTVVTGLGCLILLAAFGGSNPAHAHLFWANSSGGDGTTIARANLDGTGVNRSFIRGAQNPCGVAINRTHIYWGNRGTGSIGRARRDGRDVRPRFIEGAIFPCGVSLTSTHVYWANYFGGSGEGTIGRARLNGSEATQGLVAGSSVSSPIGTAANSSHLYWTNTDLNGPGDIEGSLYRLGHDAGPPEHLQTYPGFSLMPTWPTLAGQHLYVALGTLGVVRSELDGTTGTTGVVQASASGGIAVAGGRLYWSNGAEGTLSRSALDGSAKDFAFLRGADGPLGLAADTARSAPFTFGAVRRNRRRGTARLTVVLPGPGRLRLTGQGLRGAVRRAGPGRTRLRIAARGAARRRLARTGRLRVTARVTHLPRYGAPASRRRALTLISG